MKTKDKSTKKGEDKNKEDHVNQNVYDCNPSQFTTEEELEIIKRKKEKAKKGDKDKSVQNEE